MDRTRLPNRQSIRLRDFDYSQNGAYFVTLCTARRLCLLGNIEDGDVRLSPVGQVVRSLWQDLPRHTPGLTIDAWVVMPNHLHGIVVLSGSTVTGAPGANLLSGPRPGSLGAGRRVQKRGQPRNRCDSLVPGTTTLATKLLRAGYQERPGARCDPQIHRRRSLALE